MTPLAKIIEALLFLSPEPVSLDDLRDATQQDEWAVLDALTELRDGLHGRGVVLKEIGGGWTLASHPGAEEAARRLLSKPRTPTLTPAQAETLSVVAYLQPVSRPEMARIRGVASESATAALAERGLIEEAGRSPFGAVLYRTTPLFLKLFGLRTLEELPELEQWDPSPEDQAALRDRLLRAGDERTGASRLAFSPIPGAVRRARIGWRIRRHRRPTHAASPAPRSTIAVWLVTAARPRRLPDRRRCPGTWASSRGRTRP